RSGSDRDRTHSRRAGCASPGSAAVEPAGKPARARAAPAANDGFRIGRQPAARREVAPGRPDRPARPVAREPPGPGCRARVERRAGRVPRDPNRTRTSGRLVAGRIQMITAQDDTRRPLRLAGLALALAVAFTLAACDRGGAKDEHAAEGASSAEQKKEEGHSESEG